MNGHISRALETALFVIGLTVAINLVMGPETPTWKIAAAFAVGTVGHLLSYVLIAIRWRDEGADSVLR